MKLYHKMNMLNGQVFGTKDATGTVRHTCRLYSDRPVEVLDSEAKKLLEAYPKHVGRWDDKDREANVRDFEAYRTARFSAKPAGLNIPYRGAAKRPSRKAPKQKKEDAEKVPTVDEPIPEKEAKSPLHNQPVPGSVDDSGPDLPDLPVGEAPSLDAEPSTKAKAKKK